MRSVAFLRLDTRNHLSRQLPEILCYARARSKLQDSLLGGWGSLGPGTVANYRLADAIPESVAEGFHDFL